MRIDPYRAYVKKDGEIGRNFREYREGTASARGKFLTAEDAAPGRQARPITRGAHGRSVMSGPTATS